MPDHDSYNQTLFLEQEPFIEGSHQASTKPTRVVKKPSPLIFFIIIGLFFLVVYLSLRSLRHQPSTSNTLIEPSPSMDNSPTETSDEIENLYRELETDLKNADPTINILPFPPVNRTLFIDQ